jgi:hypothetical protein
MGGPDRSRLGPEPGGSETAVKRIELIEQWEEIDAFLQLTPTARPHRSLVTTDVPLETVQTARARFVTLVDEEIQVVRATRDAVAHARPVDDRVLDEVLELGRELVRVVRKSEAMLSDPSSASASGLA